MDRDKTEKSLTKNEKKENKVKSIFSKFIEVINKRWLIKGTTTIILIAIIFTIYLLTTKLLDKVTLPEIDLTKNKLYSLSEETKTKISQLDKDINITLVNYGDNNTIKNIFEKYKALNSKLKVEEINDLTSRADIMSKYSLVATDSLIIISIGEKETTLTNNDLSTYDYSTYEQIDITEEAITNAIINIETENKPKIYINENHAYYSSDYYATFIKELEDDANEVTTIDIFATGNIPEDCECLVITSLKEDFTTAEKDSIISYINNGGKLLVLSGSNSNKTALPNFYEILNLYGIVIKEGILFEENSDNMLNNYPDILVENMSANSTTKNMKMELKGCFVDASAIEVIEDEDKIAELGITYETLSTTSEDAYIRTNLEIKSNSRTSQDSEKGTYTIGTLVTKKINDTTNSKLIIYSNELFANDMAIPLGNYQYPIISLYNNKDIISNAVAYLTQRENLITIRKSFDTVNYSVTQQQNNIIMAIIFITPIIIIITGIIVWQIRRKKNK